jgi:shikimate kinase
MIQRLKNIRTRGIVRIEGQSLQEMYNQRLPLYEKYADIRIDCSDDDFESIVEKIVDRLQVN